MKILFLAIATSTSEALIQEPTLIFFVVLLIVLLSPIVMGRLRIPHIIGLVLSGVVVGPYGLNLLERDNSFELFGRVGLYYIMFLAALELDLSGMVRNWRRVALFGILAFALPLALVYVGSRLMLGYTEGVSVLLGCMMSSSTLIAYPIVSRYGLQKKPSVYMSVGATLFSLTLSLVGLAWLVAAVQGGGSLMFWVRFWGQFVLFCIGCMVIIPRLARYFLRRYSDAVMQFIFVLSVMFLCAALSEVIGLEGVFGAFLSGLVLNRYIPHVSPLMNRLEFTGNAIFIPYFLIGVGMLINVRLVYTGESVLWTTAVIAVLGTLGKAIASYLTAFACKLPRSSGTMMFGLTTAHAAGAIAMVMVGLRLVDAEGQVFVNDDILNSVVLMILLTCIVSTLITDHSAQKIVLRDQDIPEEFVPGDDDEKILVPVKYPDYANRLILLATLMRNPHRKQALAALSVVYDDEQLEVSTQKSRQLLEQVVRYASSSEVQVETQIRVAANIANGIKHAFKEFRASEILIGMHMHMDRSHRMWGEFHQSLFNGLNRQIMMAKISTPLSTLRHITVIVPSRAQFEAGFYRWLERLCRLSGNLNCHTTFHARQDTMRLIESFVGNRHPSVRASYCEMEHWSALPQLASSVAEDQLLVVVTARKGTVSYKNAQERLLAELGVNHNGRNLLIIFPDQHGGAMEEMTFAQSQHTEEVSFYEQVRKFFVK